MNPRYKRLPASSDLLGIPVSSREAATAALTLNAPCRPIARWVQRMAFVWINAFGARSLPGRAAVWKPPIEERAWAELTASWERELGPFDAMAFRQRAPSAVAALMVLLLRRGAPLAFIKLRREDAAGLHREWDALAAVHRFQPRTFFAPEPLAMGKVVEWSFLATTSLPPQIHRVPSSPPLEAIAHEIGGALESLPRPGGTPCHWRPMHGDFAPWNLRQLGDGRLVLYDWEDVGWGPPGADEVLYEAVIAALRRSRSRPHRHREAAEFWASRLNRRESSSKRDLRLAAALASSIAQMQG